MRTRKIINVALATIISASSLAVLVPSVVHAAAITWSGAGSDYKFSNTANWVGGVVPANGDSVVFPSSVPASKRAASFDLTGVALSGITFSGLTGAGGAGACATNNDAYDKFGYQILGTQTLNLSGIVDNQMTGSCSNVFIYDDLIASGNLTVNGNILVGGDGIGGMDKTLNISTYTLTLNTSASSCTPQIIYSAISGSGNVVKTGTSVSYLANANTYTGTTTVSQGSLGVLSAQGLGSAAGGTTVADGGQLDLGFVVADASLAEPLTIAGSGSGQSGAALTDYSGFGCGGGGGESPTTLPTLTLTGTVALTGNAQLYLGSSDFKVTGDLSGSYTIGVKNGSTGKLIIESANNSSQTPNGTIEVQPFTTNYADDDASRSVIIVNKETASVDGHIGATSVSAGGTLKGSGTVGNLFVSPGATVAPGHSPGCLSTGNLDLQGTYQAELGGTTACDQYDQLKVTGTVNLTGSTLATVLYNDFKPKKGDSFTIIDNDTAADAVTGTFKDLAEGATFDVSGYTFKISYVGGDGNDVVLTVLSVATPNTGFSLIGANPLVSVAVTTAAAGALIVASRRRSRSSYKQ